MTPIEQLKSVLCDQAGNCCIAGSDEDRAIINRALQALAAPVQEPVTRSIKSMLQPDAYLQNGMLNPKYTTPPAQPEPMRLYVEDFARKCGWGKDSGEGAFEYVQRKSYAQGLEDATPPAAQPAPEFECPRCGHCCAQR